MELLADLWSLVTRIDVTLAEWAGAPEVVIDVEGHDYGSAFIASVLARTASISLLVILGVCGFPDS